MFSWVTIFKQCFQKRCLSPLLAAGRRKTNKQSKFADFVLPCLPYEGPLFGQAQTHTHTPVLQNKFGDQLRFGATCSSPTNLWVIQSLDSSYAPLSYFFQMLKCFFLHCCLPLGSLPIQIPDCRMLGAAFPSCS